MARHVLDCGCVLTDEGRAWCPSCMDTPQPKPYLPPADVETLREIAEKMETGTDYLLDKLHAIIARLEGEP